MFRIGRFASATGQRWKYQVWLATTAAAIAVSAAFFSLWRGNPADLPVGLTTAVYFQSASSGSFGGGCDPLPSLRYPYRLVPYESRVRQRCYRADYHGA